jgi:hypothetical protein
MGYCPHNLKLVDLVGLLYLSYSFSHSSRACKNRSNSRKSLEQIKVTN